ncbi:tRNA 2-thiouridine(34) synthase MnmA [Ilumatobacter sp.]|uniref:tRNA 2-thiouridine(34) synthase MnmA n=1 Tax=Ilumatobacter sp. TaxID=1967498 RepID=UPI003AF6B9DA
MLAMSGGVDSSVAGALLLADGHEVVGVTMKLWGGDSDTGCCSVSDVDDARRVAQQLDVDHLVFNFGDDFDRHVVEPYVRDHAAGITPNPCIECNRHVKFDRLLHRADQLGFDAVATGHHARLGRDATGAFTLERGADAAKDQSYVVHMLDQEDLRRTLFPVGHIDKGEVRRLASEMGLRTATKPDSQDVCFITSANGRETFLGERIAMRPGEVVDRVGAPLGRVEAVEMVTIGQRRGIGLPGGGPKRYVVDVDVPNAIVTVGDDDDLLRSTTTVVEPSWIGDAVIGSVLVQCSAHGAARPAAISPVDGAVLVEWSEPQRRVAPGQSVVFYDLSDRRVLGGGVAAR